MLDIGKPIPAVPFPSIPEYTIQGIGEEMVSVSEYGFLTDSQYFMQRIPGAYKDCYVRKTIITMLNEAEKKLPYGYRLLIYDGYRPICVQQRLWNYYRQKVVRKNPGISEKEIDRKTEFFVSKPSLDVKRPSLHNTGGAVDLTIIGRDGRKLNMGTSFDDFSDKAWTAYYESHDEDVHIRDNRRLLYHAMSEAGFTNLPSEWWHFDYGTKFWAFFKETDALYEGVLDMDLGHRLYP